MNLNSQTDRHAVSRGREGRCALGYSPELGTLSSQICMLRPMQKICT